MGVNVDVLLAEIEIAYRHLKEWSYPDSSLSGQSFHHNAFGKDNSQATTYRNMGNGRYHICEDRDALELYTRSVASAKKNSEELSLAYANRSAVLLRLGEYVPCLLDINRALKGEYPKHLRKKLRARKKTCLIEIARMGRVKIVGDETDPFALTATNKENKIPRDNFDNPLLPNTSSKVELACDEKWGRHMVAVKDIEPGEILSCEPFFTTFLFPHLKFTHCSYCSARCTSLISCHSCSQIMYCSENCLTRASNAYHRTECRMWTFVEDESSAPSEIIINKLSVALRILLVGTEQGAKLRQLTARLSVRELFKENVNPVNKPYAGDYLSLLQLRQTFDQPSKASTMLAVKAIIWLRRFSFFKNHPDPNSMSKEEIFVTLALLNHMQSIPLYCYGIAEMSCSPILNMSHIVESEKVNIGCGMVALHNLVNHSCDPNVECVNTRAQEHIIFSLRTIRRGEQIFIGYCSSFSRKTLAERKRKLLLYGFTCCCEACTNDWPLCTSMMDVIPKFIRFDANVMMEITMTILKMIGDKSMRDTNIQNLVRCRKLIQDYIRPPSLFSVLCEDIMVRYMMWTYSNLLCYENNDSVAEEEGNLSVNELEMLMALFNNTFNIF